MTVALVVGGCEIDLLTPTEDNIATEQAPWGSAAADEPRALDVFYPQGFSRTQLPPDARPVIVMINGGWGGDEGQDEAISPVPHFTELGFVVVSLRFTHRDLFGSCGPTDSDPCWPLQGQDVDTAIRWLRAYHADLGIRPDAVILHGLSGGSHLAARVTVGDIDPDPALPAEMRDVSAVPDGLILINGPHNLRIKEHFAPGATDDEDKWTRPIVKGFLGGCDPWDPPTVPPYDPANPDGDPDDMPLCDPAAVDEASLDGQTPFAQFPRTFIYAALDDALISQSQSLGLALLGLCPAGTYVEWHFPDTGGHLPQNLEPTQFDSFLSEWMPGIAPSPPPPWPADKHGTCNA